MAGRKGRNVHDMEIYHDAIGRDSERGMMSAMRAGDGEGKWNEKSCILINISFFMITLNWIFMLVIKINTKREKFTQKLDEEQH